MTPTADKTNRQLPNLRSDSALPVAVTNAIKLGWSAIPVRPNKTPFLTGWKDYQTRRATLDEVEAWQAKFTPPAWAVVTGEISSLVVLDFDGDAGRATLNRLGLEPHVETGSGGFHVYFEHPGWRVRTLNGKTRFDLGRLYPGLDIRADGGYAVFWGRNTAGVYEKLRPRTPDNLSLLPKNLRELLGLQISDRASTIVRNSRRSNEAKDILLVKALERISNDGRNNSGFWLSLQLRRSGYSYAAAEPIMAAYAERVPDTNSKGAVEPYTKSEALASLRQAYSGAARATADQYFAADTGLFWRKPSKDGDTIVELTNFRARIVADVVTDDGVETRRKFTVAAILSGRPTTVSVTAHDFPDMSWVYEQLGPTAVISAGYAARDHCRAAIQLLSQDIAKSRVYLHTGWRRIVATRTTCMPAARSGPKDHMNFRSRCRRTSHFLTCQNLRREWR